MHIPASTRALLAGLLLTTAAAHAQAPTDGTVQTSIDSSTGAITSITIAGDSTAMNWIIQPDGSQLEWVGRDYGWGLGYFTLADSLRCRWNAAECISADGLTSIYREAGIEVRVARSNCGKDLCESYTFTNCGSQKAALSDIGIFTPFNDNYPDALTCMSSRCHAHIWEGGNGAYINLLRMGAKGPHLGLLVTEGAVDGYDVFERDYRKWSSQFRGVFALRLPPMELEPGESRSMSWRIFVHQGSDFRQELLSRGGVYASADSYVLRKGRGTMVRLEGADGPVALQMDGRNIRLRHIKGEYRARLRPKGLGSHRFEFSYVDGRRTWGELLVISSDRKILDKRRQFILERQQMRDSLDPRYGAFLVYDNELEEMFLNDRPTCSPLDRNEGAERMGMGIFLAKEYLRRPDRSLVEPLETYARFIREKLQDEDYHTYSNVTHTSRNRGYNYIWIAMYDFEMYRVTGKRQYAEDGYRTLRSFYDQFGYKFYAIHIPVMLGMETLAEAGMTAEREDLLNCYVQMGDTFAQRGLDYPKHEVNYEQSIVAPAISFLCQLYLVTGDDKYLNAARLQMPVLEAFGGDQPTYHKNGIAIRHWDGYWFGKREMLGDCFPHYWSVLTAEAYWFFAECTGEKQWLRKAENIVRNNLCQFDEQGHGSCAYVYPDHVNGEPAKYYDAFANDQDFALVSYCLVKYGIL